MCPPTDDGADEPDEWTRKVPKFVPGKGFTTASESAPRSPRVSVGRYFKRAYRSGEAVDSDSDGRIRKAREGLGRVSTGNDGNRHVVPNKDRGGWDVVKENHERSSGHFETQKEAVDRAREIVDKTSRGNGEIVIHGKNGKIRDSDSGRRNESRAKDTK